MLFINGSLVFETNPICSSDFSYLNNKLANKDVHTNGIKFYVYIIQWHVFVI